jgi:diguanylate cyclase (GGDEF)-like protein/PAS domain S-box-containing protein
MAAMQSGASRRAPIAVPAVRRRSAPKAPVAPAHPATDAATLQQVVIDLFEELNAIVERATARARALTKLHGGALTAAQLEGENAALSADLGTVVQRAAKAAWTLSRAGQAVVEVTTLCGKLHRATAGRGDAGRTGDPAVVAGHPWPVTAVSAREISGGPEAEDGAGPQSNAGTGPETEGGAAPRVGRRGGARSSVTVPLYFGEVGIGAVTVTSSRSDAFSPAQSEALRHLGTQVQTIALRLHLIGKLHRLDQEFESLRETGETLFHRLFFDNPQPMWVIEIQTERFLLVNDAACAKYGYSREEFAELPAGAVRRDAAQWAVDLGKARTRNTSLNARHRLRDGRVIDVEITTGPQEFEGRAAILSIMNDVTERNQLQKELRDGALRDPLTGRANRALFTERLGHALAQAQRRSAVTAVLFVDVDDFKRVNDSAGYAVGDAVLQAIAARLAVTLRPGDTVARLSADEFAVLLEDVGAVDRAVDVADRLHDAFTSPLEFRSGSLTVGVSIGVAASTISGPGPQEMLRDARLAMQAAKDAGRGLVEVFSPRMSSTAMERLSLDQDLRHAVERGELRLCYQPLISMESGAIVGCEALVRWQHPTRGLVPPDSFIPLAEEIGMISAIDTWVLRTACLQAAAWGEAGHPDFFVAVNVSGRELGRADLVDRIEAVLFESGLPPDRLEIEITESTAAAQPAEALEELHQLRRAGISIAIDDFGTGYSSLSKLANFPADRLKIDRSFLSGVKSERDDAPLVSATIALAHQLGMKVTAEGVETPAQLAFLRRRGCDLLQGYLFSRPVPADQFEALLAQPPAAIIHRLIGQRPRRSLSA